MVSPKNTPEIKLIRTAYKSDAIAVDDLNEQQKAVINHRSTKLLVLGKGGSGKTSTLISAITNRISNGDDPNSILAITYGRSSASKLRDQIAAANPKAHTVNEPIARTFHSLAFMILNDPINISAGENKKYVLLSGAEQDAQIRELLAQDIKDLSKTSWPKELIPALATRGFAKELREFINRATERGSSPDELLAASKKHQQKYWPAICDFWRRYKAVSALKDLTPSNSIIRIDPSEIVIEAVEKLESNQILLEKYRKLFKVIYVDEFQESDKAQRKLLQLLSGDELVIFADPDSAVGRFRGADPENLLTDLEDSGIKNKIVLPTVYRNIKEKML